MRKIIKCIKSLFVRYKPGYEYWVNLKDIKVNPEWRKQELERKSFQGK